MIDKFYQQPFPECDLNQDYKLRPQIIEDAAEFYRYYNDPEVNKYILATPPPTLADAQSEVQYGQSLFKHRRGIYWSLARKDTNKMIGTVGFYINNTHHRGELFYELDKEYWQRGIMSLALQEVIRIGFTHIGLHRIEAINLIENLASTAILKKFGFIYEGRLHNYRYFKGQPHSVELYSLCHP